MGKRFAVFGNRNFYKSSMALAFMITPFILSAENHGFKIPKG
jgi:hypothetical protein